MQKKDALAERQTAHLLQMQMEMPQKEPRQTRKAMEEHQSVVGAEAAQEPSKPLVRVQIPYNASHLPRLLSRARHTHTSGRDGKEGAAFSYTSPEEGKSTFYFSPQKTTRVDSQKALAETIIETNRVFGIRGTKHFQSHKISRPMAKFHAYQLSCCKTAVPTTHRESGFLDSHCSVRGQAQMSRKGNTGATFKLCSQDSAIKSLIE